MTVREFTCRGLPKRASAKCVFKFIDCGKKKVKYSPDAYLVQMNRTKKYMDCFCRILDEEKILYKIHGVFKNHLPISKFESAQIIGVDER